MPSERKWQSLQNIGVFTSEMDDDIIVYNPLSAETHQLNQLALDALAFMQQPTSLEHLARHLSSLYQIHDLAELRVQLISLIEQFDDLGLIK